MDPREQQFQPSADDQNREATDNTATTDSPLAAERFSQAADRITRRIDKIADQKPRSERSITLRFIVIGIITLAIVSVLGVIYRYRSTPSPAELPPKTVPYRTEQPPLSVAPASSSPVRQQPQQETSRDIPQRNLPAVFTESKDTAPNRTAYAGTARRSYPASRRVPAVPRTQVQAHTTTPSAADTSSGEDEPDIDHTIAFYEPVNRSVKSGSFNVRDGREGKITGHNGSAVLSGKTNKYNYIKMTASLAAKAGGTLDEVLEHNGAYYKIRLTLPVKRIEYFKKSLAVQDAIATLSVTAESTTSGFSVIVLEMNTR